MPAALETMIRDLHRRPGRSRRGLCLAEGIRLVEEAVAAEVELRAAVVSPSLERSERGVRLRRALGARVALTEMTDAALAELAATEHPQGVIAALAWKPADLAAITPQPTSVVVVLDAIQDPGNVGTIARTAWALGAAGMIALPGTAELTNPKTLRASMGAFFHLPAVAVAEEPLGRWLRDHRFAIVTAGPDGSPLGTVDLPRPFALVLGNEGAGAESMLAREARARITIPLRSGVDSLNVAVAAGILLYGTLRDR
jgi:TrmH family RNA methyltransferase